MAVYKKTYRPYEGALLAAWRPPLLYAAEVFLKPCASGYARPGAKALGFEFAIARGHMLDK